ncbi:S-adenosylmethionine synthetase, partial [Bifidobacteriaceae bacterium WP021]
KDIKNIIHRLSPGKVKIDITVVPQDKHLSRNQDGMVRCADNGIFKGVPLTGEQRKLSTIARKVYEKYPYDGKYVLDGEKLII